jgi:uncharacterized protein YfaS (alpha-2-macroglobulin family)
MIKVSLVLGVVSVLVVIAAGMVGKTGGEGPPTSRDALTKLQRDGNFKDALEGFRIRVDNMQTPAVEVGLDLRDAVQCLVQLGRVDEVNALLDRAITVHAGNWRLRRAAAESLLEGNVQHDGSIVAGTFHRGPHRGGTARWANSLERDRVLGLQWLVKGLDTVAKEPDRKATGAYFLTLAHLLMSDREQRDSWRLQTRTPLDSLPDYGETPSWAWGQSDRGAPVDAAGNPVVYTLPKDFETAASDGQRWRWALAQAAAHDPGLLNKTRIKRADFLSNQFGVETLAGFLTPEPGSQALPETGPFAVNTLADDETIARLATGPKRFKFPDDQNPIKLYQTVADEPATGLAPEALDHLAHLFLQRSQLDRAAGYLERALEKYGDPTENRKHTLDQIRKPLGRFEPQLTQPADKGAQVEFRFRNARKVHFVAREVAVERLVADIQAYLRSAPKQLAYEKIDLNQIGSHLIHEGGEKYLKQTVAEWDLDLDPRPGHLDRQITVTTPLQKAGTYLLTATLEDGNTSRIVVRLDDLAIVKKPKAGGALLYVADARTGQPAAGARVDAFGWSYHPTNRPNTFQMDIKTGVYATDANGLTTVPGENAWPQHQWLFTARTPDGRSALLGFTNVWAQNDFDPAYNAIHTFPMTDRPVYRPGATVHFKFWVRRAFYGQVNDDEFAGQTFTIEVRSPRGEKLYNKSMQPDAFGGLEGQLALASDATLGSYLMQVAMGEGEIGGGVPMAPTPPGVPAAPEKARLAPIGGGQFRVEEYKKPEFEVSVEAPEKPVMLGETVPAKILAKYYFGGPVTEAKVKYKVTRTPVSERWYPVARWDWLFGSGYGWFASDSNWYPGWSSWGHARPNAWWWGGPSAPPEVVAEAEVPIGADGTVSVKLDTSVAKAVHSDQDHRYEITAEVTDRSRRTITGTGTVLVARRPFSVTTWVDRGHYRAGERVRVFASAQTLDHRPVAAKGSLTLLQVTYDAQHKPVETPVQSWDVASDADGQVGQELTAAASGQYRLSTKLTDESGHTIEGGYLFTVTGQGFDGASFRFNDLEVIPDKPEYRPGDRVRLMLNTNHTGATVLLFLNAHNSVYSAPLVVRMKGKSEVVELIVEPKDQPNFFVEAVTVAAGKAWSESKQIVVPPESRVADVRVQPEKPSYRPGQKGKVRLELTGPDGKPFVGSTVLTVYDKAVEAIAGGSNVPDIKSVFWNWKRSHRPMQESSLDRISENLLKPKETGMVDLGLFGELVSDFNGALGVYSFKVRGHSLDMNGMGGMGGGGGMRGMAMAKADAPALYAPGAFSRLAAPAATAAPLAAREERVVSADSFGEAGAPPVQPVVRSNFADTAFWAGSVTTDSEGVAEVEVPLPDSLTTWKVRAWCMGPGTRVGQGAAEIITTKDLLVRLQAPRFFVEKDEVVLSANVHNKLKTDKKVQVVLELDGSTLEPLDPPAKTVTIAAGKEDRIDWRVRVVHEGDALIRMKALTDEESDAAQLSFKAYVHGMLKTDSFSRAIRPDGQSAELVVRVPAERRADLTRLEVRYSPTLAGAMVDALPYLADYPYGCTEQTLNRFLPTVITQRVLIKLGLDLAAIRAKRTNLNAQELGDPKQRARGWQLYPHQAVFDEAEVARMARSGLQRLADMQLSDGGWGWFSGFGEHSSAHTTALVVHGLQIGRRNDMAIPAGMLERGLAWLETYQAEQVRQIKNAPGKTYPYKLAADDTDALVFYVLATSDKRNSDMLNFIDRDRTRLSVYGKTLIGLAFDMLGEKEKLAAVLRNLSQYVVQDDENQTAYLKLPGAGYWWWWYGSETETHAFYLELLARTDPKGATTSRLVKYMLNNRRHGSYWESTRDTAFCIEAMADYLEASGEDRPDMTVTVAVDGKPRKQVQIRPDDLFVFDSSLVLTGKELDAGEHRVTLSKTGKGPLYANAYLTNFTLEDPITRAGLEIKVDRKVYRMVREDKTVDVSGSRGEAVGQKVEKYRRELLPDGATLTSGEMVEVELEIDSKNDYEYLMFEDFKAAGFEAVEVRSGYNGNDLGAYAEFRDERVAFFVRNLARGKHSVSYRLRAEIPGSFHALPARGSAMYAPELKANSDEIRLKVKD